MAAANADLTKDIPYLLESWHLSSTLPVKGYFKAAVTATVPAVTGGVANTIAGGSVTATVTGVALGDAVVLIAPTTDLDSIGVANVSAVVSATDTIRITFTSKVATAITTASKTFNVVVADLT